MLFLVVVLIGVCGRARACVCVCVARLIANAQRGTISSVWILNCQKCRRATGRVGDAVHRAILTHLMVNTGHNNNSSGIAHAPTGPSYLQISTATVSRDCAAAAH